MPNQTNARTTFAHVDYLLYGDPQYLAIMTQNRLTITAEAAAVSADLIRVFPPPLCIHLLMGCLRNDTSLGYQAPFPASAQALRGRYPYGTQTHPLTSHKHQPQPQLVLNATVRLYVLQPALEKGAQPSAQELTLIRI